MRGEREHDGEVRNKGPADGTQASGDRTPHLVLRTAQPTLVDRALRTEDPGDAPRYPAQARPSGRNARGPRHARRGKTPATTPDPTPLAPAWNKG